MLIIVLSLCAFFLTLTFDANLYFFHYFFETKIEIKLSDKSIVSKKGWKQNKGSRRLNFSKSSDGVSS